MSGRHATPFRVIEQSFDYAPGMPALLDDPIEIETTPDGRPAAITWRGERYAVRVLRTWEGGVHRIAATLADGPAIGEIAQDADGQRGRLRRWWTATP